MGSGASAQKGIVVPDEALEKYNELYGKHNELEAKVDRQVAGLDVKVKDTQAAEGQRFEGLIEDLRKSFEESLAAQSEAHAREIEEVRQALTVKLQEPMTRLDAVEPQLAKFERELDQVATSAASARQELRRELEASIRSVAADSEKQASEAEARNRAAQDEQVKFSQSLRADLDDALGKCQSLQAAVDNLENAQEAARVAAEQAREEFSAAQRAFEQAAEERHDELQATVRAEVHRGLDEMDGHRQFQAAHLLQVENSIKDNMEAIKHARGIAESVHSRSMAWRLRSFHKRLAGILTHSEDACLQSPDFCVCALPEFRLELQLGGRDGGGMLDTAVPLPGVPVPVPGSCTVRIWAPMGMQMAFRMTVGEGAGAVARRFEHTFKPEVSAGLPDEQGRICFAAPNFATLDNVWTRANDSLLVVFDLLEFRCPPMQFGQSVEATRRPQLQDDTHGSEAGNATGEAPPGSPGVPPAGAGSPALGRKPSFLDPPPGTLGPPGGQSAPGLDDMAFTRSGTSEGLLEERIRNELQALRNRSVRRVEWRVEGVQRMIDVCKLGESVESPPFCAAGLERIVFHFYPKGYDASSVAGVMSPCALYISGPVRTMLRGMLHVGTLARQIEHRFRSKGDTGGRSRFGPLETQVDATDTILIALEISDVEVDLPDAGGCLVNRDAQPGAGDRASTAKGTAKGERATSRGGVEVSPAKGTLKMKREDPTKTEELIRCVSLPTLNARSLHMPVIKGRKAGAFGG